MMVVAKFVFRAIVAGAKGMMEKVRKPVKASGTKAPNFDGLDKIDHDEYRNLNDISKLA
jgi:hypothetical protein